MEFKYYTIEEFNKSYNTEIKDNMDLSEIEKQLGLKLKVPFISHHSIDIEEDCENISKENHINYDLINLDSEIFFAIKSI